MSTHRLGLLFNREKILGESMSAKLVAMGGFPVHFGIKLAIIE